MPSDEGSQSQGTGVPGVKYYKSRYFLNPAVYVQEEGQWRSYGPEGLIRQSPGTISETVMSQIEEIGESEAEGLIRVRLAKAEKLEAQTAERAPAKEDLAQGPSGLGGWLVLPIIGLLLTLVFAVIWVFRDALPALQGDVWPRIPTSGRSVMTFEVLANLVFMVVPIVLLVLLFLKRRVLPRLMVGFYAFMFLATLADSIAILVIGPDLIPDPVIRAEAGWSGASITGGIVKAVITCAIWIPYFLVSKRVRNTFVNSLIPEPLPQRIATFEQPSIPGTVGTVAMVAPLGPTAREPRRTLGWVLGTCLVVVLALVGVLIWRCAAPSETADAPSSGSAQSSSSGAIVTKTYTDPDYGYSFEYPAGWSMSDQTDIAAEDSLSGAQVFDPRGAGIGLISYTVASVSVNGLGYTFDESMLPQLESDVSASIAEAERSGDVQVVVPVTATTVGGLKGQMVTILDLTTGTPATSRLYFLYDDELMYTLLVQAANTDWDENQAAFDTIIDSFDPGD